MNIPSYGEHPTPGNETIYCACFLDHKGHKLARYLSPTGWQRIAHYFRTQKEAEDTFNRIGQTPLPEANRRDLDSIEYANFIRDEIRRDFDRDLDCGRRDDYYNRNERF